MAYHLLIQPFDSEFDFLEDIGKQAKTVYKPKIGTFEVLPKVKLPDSTLTLWDYTDKFFLENLVSKLEGSAPKRIMKHHGAGEKMVYVNDIFEEMKSHWAYNSKEIFLGVLPYFIFGLTDTPNGEADADLNMAIVSNYGIEFRPRVSIGVGVHEIGHNIGLGHCKNKGCLMKTPGNFEDFYDGVYSLCEKHKKKLAKV